MSNPVNLNIPNMVVIEGFTGSSVSEGQVWQVPPFEPPIPSSSWLPMYQGTQLGQTLPIGVPDVGPNRAWVYINFGSPSGMVRIPANTAHTMAAVLAAIGGPIDQNWLIDCQRRVMLRLCRVVALWFDGSGEPDTIVLQERCEPGVTQPEFMTV